MSLEFLKIVGAQLAAPVKEILQDTWGFLKEKSLL
jgi:hypothetical protein